MSRNSPLQHLLGRPGLALALAERAFLGHVIVRGDAADAAFANAARSVLGVALPRRANTLVQAANATVLWLGPDEWLVQTPAAHRAPLLEQLRKALAGQHAAVTDVSDGHTVIVLDEPRAAELLARGCPLDLHLSVFAVGSCAQSLLGKAGVLIVREAPERFAITVRRSFAAYVFHALQDAGALAVS
jgi:sarcosine oxidase subunit gamma